MKRVYRDKKKTNSFRYKINRLISSTAKSWHKLLVLFLLLTVVFFGIALFAVSTEAKIWPPTVEKTETVNSPEGRLPDPPYVEAVSAILMDTVSGNVLYRKSADAQLPTVR